VRDVTDAWAGAENGPDDLGLVDVALARHLSVYAGSVQRFHRALQALGAGLAAISGGTRYVEGCVASEGKISEHAWAGERAGDRP
jgi:hypothetical protein